MYSHAMSGTSARDLEHRSEAKRSAARSSVVAALAITLLKLFTGIVTGSLGMLSEAVHSAIDLVAATITLFTVRISDRPADEEHNYGHGKLESISAGVEIVAGHQHRAGMTPAGDGGGGLSGELADDGCGHDGQAQRQQPSTHPAT